MRTRLTATQQLQLELVQQIMPDMLVSIPNYGWGGKYFHQHKVHDDKIHKWA